MAPNPRKGPWKKTAGDKAVHPKAPAGGGGAGTFTTARPLQGNRKPDKTLAHPQSPVGKDSAPIDSARDLSVPPPPALDMRAKLLVTAKEYVGKPVISNPRNGDGTECYDMVEKLLGDIGAQSAPDVMKRSVSGTEDYKWGESVPLDKIQPGDILQIRDNHLQLIVATRYKSLQPGTTAPDGETVTTDLYRGHHTAIVIGINSDGSLQVSEQHVLGADRKALSTTIRENKLPLKDIDGEPVITTTTKDSVKVEKRVTTSWKVVSRGKLMAYKPLEKKK